MVSRRGIPRTFLVPAFAAALLLIAYYKKALLGNWLSPSSLCAVVSPQRKTVSVVQEQTKTVLSKDTEGERFSEAIPTSRGPQA